MMIKAPKRTRDDTEQREAFDQEPRSDAMPLGSGVGTHGLPEAIESGQADSDVAPSAAPVQPKWESEYDRRRAAGFDWAIVFWIAILHLGVLAAPFTFTWQGLVVAIVLAWLTAGIGICLGYHRLFTHRGFETYKPLRYLIAWIGQLAGEGSVIHWVANHRKHHARSDQVGDPHSPNDGPWWSHMFWFMHKMRSADYQKYNQRWAPELAKDPVMKFLDRTFILWHLLLSGALFGIGCLVGGVPMGWSFMVWGMFVRLIYVLHTTWLVNSATHIWGYRNYETKDNSRNLWWVALLSNGEGWHNNHHAHPRLARHGHKWWELDTTFMVIRSMKRLGLVWEVISRIPEQKQTDTRRPGPSESAQVSPDPAQNSCADA